MIKAIIFDMGGVILTDKAESLYKKFCEILKVNFETFWKIYAENKLKILKGELAMKDFTGNINEGLGTNFDAHKILDAFEKAHLHVMKTNTELLGFVKKLRANYKTAVISNAAKEGYKITKSKGLYSDFDVSIVSCEV